MFSNKFLFLLTINEPNRLSEYLINRPGRIHYHIKYVGLDESIISDVIDDKLINLDGKEKIQQICNYLGDISMDILTSVIEEANLYPDFEPKELIKDMNLECSDTYYNYTVKKNGKIINTQTNIINENPLASTSFYFGYYYKNKDGAKSRKDVYLVYDSVKDPVEIIIENNIITIKNSIYTVEFKKSKRFIYRY